MFARDDVVEFYSNFIEGLLPCEEYVFAKAIPPSSRVLDLGVGAGRTSAVLSKDAAVYVGLDYVPEMVESCQRRFPDLEFVCGDAADLSMFGDGSFDAVVFSFNGIDCLYPLEKRSRCLSEIRRVLSPGGAAVLCAHNPRAIVTRPKALKGASLKIAAARLADSALDTIKRTIRYVPRPLFVRGRGYYFDPIHGGLWLHAATPANFVEEVESAGLKRIGEIVGMDHPARSRWYMTGWYYYVFIR